MTERRRQLHPPTMLDVNQMSDSELQMYGNFTPDEDEEFHTPPTATQIAAHVATITPAARTTTTTTRSSVFSKQEYKPHTLKSYNQTRQRVLPIFPARSSSMAMIRSSRSTTTTAVTTANPGQSSSDEEIDLLLSNVPKSLLTLEQYQRRERNAYVPLFEIRTWDEIRKKNYQSYMVTFHTNMYMKLGKSWHIDIPILDCNLARLQQCALKNDFHFTSEDLPIALEFFLQTDVDMFNLKTCSFRQSERRIIIDENGQQFYEGIFAVNQQSNEGRYGLTPCNTSNCYCCSNRIASSNQFNPKQIYTFLNGYKAILNCPVTCKTSNIIYALTCVCGEKDYIAHTNLPFVDCLLYHRREVIRMIHEFFIGDINVDLINLDGKSEKTKMNDKNWLYQHTVRCPVALKVFLERNPIYWCFVPLAKERTLRSRTYARPLPPLAVTEQIVTTTDNLPVVRRSDAVSMRFTNNIPAPPQNYIWTHELFAAQKAFFKYGRDRDPINMHKVEFYNAEIVAVLPDNASNTVKKFIESLFITHGECHMNRMGRLIKMHFYNDFPARGDWCHGLTGRPLHSMLS